jgi:AraC-like DNA-binding protein
MRTYREWPASAALRHLVVCTWVDPGRPRRPPVLPDACIDLVWDGGWLRVVGPDTCPAPVLDEATYVGLRFRPGAAPSVLGVAASELVDRSVALAELWGPDAEELAERLSAAVGVGAGGVAADGVGPCAVGAGRVGADEVEADGVGTDGVGVGVGDNLAEARRMLEEAVLARDAPPRHPLVDALLGRLSHDAARGPVGGRLADDLGVSDRTLRRQCEEAIGYGPKMLDRVLRGRRALRLIRSGVALAETAVLAGYADQAHLSHEVQRLAGAAPSQIRRLPELTISANGYG